MAGPGWAKYYVGPLQFAICFGTVIGGPLVGGKSLKVINHCCHFTVSQFPILMLLCLLRSYIFFLFAVNLPSVQPRGINEAVSFYYYMWSHNTDFGSTSIFSLPEARQYDFSDS